MATRSTQAIKLFYCYARVDKALRDELDIHLAPLKRSGLVTSWYDGEIIPGARWEEEINHRLNTADIILLLISPMFIASDYCYSKEMSQAIARHDAGSACVIPILLRPTFWEDAPFSKLQMLPEHAKPVTLWHNLDEALLYVTKGIYQAIIEYTTRANNQHTPTQQSSFTPSKIPNRNSQVIKEQEDDFTRNAIGIEKIAKSTNMQTSNVSDTYQQNNLFTALDIGTSYVKAIIVEVKGDHAEVLGVGRHPQSYTHMTDGIVSDIASVIANCNEALLKAELAAGNIIAPSTVIGIGNELVKGSSITVSKQRSKPMKQITAEELEGLITTAQQRLLNNSKERIVTETGYTNIDVRLTNTAVISVRIDGHIVSNPIGFRGQHFSLTLFSAFAPLTQLGALETVAQGLDLTLAAIVAEPYALARCLSTNASADSGAIFIDVGGGTTNIALVRQGGTEEIRTFALGGHTFTRRIATSKGIPIKEAERIKIIYSDGQMKGHALDEIQAILAPECQTWMDSVEILMEELSKGELLPPAIYLVGGGSVLPDLQVHLRSFRWIEHLPFSRQPIIRLVQPEMVGSILDHKGMLFSVQDITPMALAYQAVELNNENDALERALDRVSTAMHI